MTEPIISEPFGLTDLTDLSWAENDKITVPPRATPLRPGVTVCILAHPNRFGRPTPDHPDHNGLLARAFESVTRQTHQPDAVVIVNDKQRLGAGPMRQRALDAVDTEWMAWLDSDDEWYPQHLERLLTTAERTGACFVFPWFDSPGDPLGHFGLPFNPATPHHTTITYLVRTSLAKQVGYSTDGIFGSYSNEDWVHLLGLCKLALEQDLPMVHLAERTWYWHMGEHNTSGLPGQGDAA